MYFINDLDSKITIAELMEQRQMMREYTNRNFAKTTAYMTALAVSTVSSALTDNPYFLIGGGAIMVTSYAALKVKDAIFNYQASKAMKEALLNQDVKVIKNIRYRLSFYQAKLKINSPSAYYLRETEIVKEPIETTILEGPIPMAIFNPEETTNRLFYEYDLFHKKYDLPDLCIKKEEMTIFVDAIAQSLSSKNLPHRLYTYLTDYFQMILVKNLIRYNPQITINDLVNDLNLFTCIDFTEEEIEELKNNINKSLKNLINTKKMSLK